MRMRMKTGVERALAVAAGAVLLTGSGLPAQASLGGDAGSVAADRAQLNAQVTSSTGAGFTVQALTLPTGTVVSEYLSPQGQVFAIRWKGPSIPGLRQILGSYYTTFRQTVDNAPRGPDHRHLSVVQPGLVVSASSHIRNHRGLVYVPALLPQGVSPADLR
jgi:hypothetical protein